MAAGAESDDVAAWVERLSTKAKQGEPLDLAEGLAPDSAARNPANADSWGTDRQLPAAALRAVLIDQDLAVDPHGIRINGARITGPVDLENATFEHPVHLTTCRVDQDIDLAGSTLQELILDGSHVRSLVLNQASITGSVVARAGFAATGQIRALGATIGGNLELDGATLTNPDGNSLGLEAATVAGSVFLRNGFEAEGQILALNASIGGQIDLGGATLTNPGGTALGLEAATVAGSVFLRNGFEAEGQILALGASIGGQLVLSGAILANPSGHALTLDGAVITGGVFADDGFKANGMVRALGASIGGQLVLNGATLTNPGRIALALDRATLTTDLYAGNGFIARGEVHAPGAIVGGLLSLVDATITNPGRDALNLGASRISGGVFAARFTTDGVVRAVGASIASVDFAGATLENPCRTALNLESSTITTLKLTPRRIAGTINLTRTTITDLRTSPDSTPPGRLIAIGWQLTDVHGLIRNKRKVAASWLNSTPPGIGFTAQPWHALAAVYDRNGQPADARRLRFTAANKITKRAPWYSKPLRWTYLAVAGHGYYPLLAALWLAAVLVLGAVIVQTNRDHFVPADFAAASKAAAEASPTPTPAPGPITAATPCDTHPDYPCFNSFTYALAGVVPAATGALKADWTIGSTAPAVLAFGLTAFRILAWIFTAILLAGVTGLLRKT